MYLDDGIVYSAWYCYLLQHADPVLNVIDLIRARSSEKTSQT